MSTARHHRTIVALGLAVAFALGACGDDDEPAVTAAEPTATTGTTGEGATVDIVDFAFDPGEITVAAGGTVAFSNGDEFAHTAEADDGSFDTGSIEGGSSTDVTFDEPGTYSYFCGIHNYMTGTVTVTG